MNPNRQNHQIHGQNIVACVWDFDKTLIPGYMQRPLFEHYDIDESTFWKEVNKLPSLYLERGLKVSSDTIYLNHLLSYVKNGPLRGLTNQKLKELGSELEFCPGLPDFFNELSQIPQDPEFSSFDFKIEHYVISTGLAPMIKGSKIYPYLEDVFACEFIESPVPPHFMSQTELSLPLDPEISQVGMTVDNTIKTRFIFEINKGSNKNPAIDVNTAMPHEDRRVPIEQMITLPMVLATCLFLLLLGKWEGRCMRFMTREMKENLSRPAIWWSVPGSITMARPIIGQPHLRQFG